MSKDEVWKIIFFSHFIDQKKFFSRLGNDKLLFHTFQDYIGMLHKITLFYKHSCLMSILIIITKSYWMCLNQCLQKFNGVFSQFRFLQERCSSLFSLKIIKKLKCAVCSIPNCSQTTTCIQCDFNNWSYSLLKISLFYPLSGTELASLLCSDLFFFL